jgi:hypothetical protein
MPLHKGKSEKIIGENISEMQDAGHPHSQAVAASLNEARDSGAKIPKRPHTIEHHNRHSSHPRG